MDLKELSYYVHTTGWRQCNVTMTSEFFFTLRLRLICCYFNHLTLTYL